MILVEVERNPDGEVWIDLTGVGREEDELYVAEVDEETGIITLTPAVVVTKFAMKELQEAFTRDALRTYAEQGPLHQSPPFAPMHGPNGEPPLSL